VSYPLNQRSNQIKKAIMNKLLILVSFLFLLSCQNEAPQQQAQQVEAPQKVETNVLPADHFSIWQKDIQKFEAADKVNPPSKNGIVFIGSSSIRLWENLERDMAPLPVIKRGFGGSKIRDAAVYSNRIVTRYEPKIVVLFSGTNDLAGNELDKQPANILNGFMTFVTKVRQDLPDAQIYNISITPTRARFDKLAEVQKTNALIKDYCESDPKLFFFDLADQFLTQDGQPRDDLFIEDGLHLNDTGYKIWVDEMKPVLEKAYSEL
jgi:lysophospholipase L1-like esterase